MPVPSYQLTCIKNELIARDVYEFWLERPKELTFKPGQFVLFDVALREDEKNIQTRAFSIGSTPTELELKFVAKLTPGGRASRWIAESLKAGDTVRTQGPFGLFLVKEDPTRELLFICTSTGNAPFRSQIKHMLENGDTRKIDLVYGVRTEEDLFWENEFQELSTKYPNFNLHLALSNPSPEWKGHRGRVQTLVPLIIQDFTMKDIYICGSPDMTKELKELCLNTWMIEKKNLHVEGYI